MNVFSLLPHMHVRGKSSGYYHNSVLELGKAR
jgi:hypothetical protein